MEYSKTKVLVFADDINGSLNTITGGHAKELYNAKVGKVNQRNGNCYVIPTLDADGKPLSFDYIKECIDKFIDYACKHPECVFLITNMKTSDTKSYLDIAPMFSFAPPNCKIPNKWRNLLQPVADREFWWG